MPRCHRQEVEQGRQPPRDIFGLLEIDTSDAQGLVSPDQGSLFRIELPADEDEGNFTPLEDEFRMFELEEKAALYLRRRFALECNSASAEFARLARGLSVSSKMTLSHGDAVVVGRAFRTSKHDG